MAQRHMCPSMGAIRRSVAVDASVISRWASRAIHSTARQQEEQASNGAPSTSTPAKPSTRRDRSATAMRQIASLRAQRTSQPGGLARGNFPSGQVASRTARESVPYDSDNFGASNADVQARNSRANSPPRFAKLAARPTTTHGSTPPPEGQMVRAPSASRFPKNATVGGQRSRGPNLGGRSQGRGGPGGKGGSGGREQGPKKREKAKGGEGKAQSTSIEDADPATTLSDGMVHHLLRLQRKEWDRVPYVPKYAPNSFAAQELIHEGRELFRGESPPVKIWGPLEKRIGVVGMFGAEAHLKVRRVGDGDEMPFGKEHEVDEQMESSEQQEAGKEAAVQ